MMRFPLPADTFPPLLLSEEDQVELQKLAEGFVHEAFEEYTDFRCVDGGVLDKERWKAVKTRDGVTSYRDLRMVDPERSRVAPKEKVGSSQMTASTKLHGVLAVGTVPGEFNDMAFGLVNATTEMLKLKSSYTKDKIVDAKMKKLNWLLKTTKTVILDRHSDDCTVCGKPVSRSRSCQVCLSTMCSRCAVTKKLSFLSPTSRRVSRRSLTFCARCILAAYKADALDIAAEELVRQNPFDFYERSTGSSASSRAPSPSNSIPPDATSEFFG
ncbi:hypothetical protein PRNP1_015125 [Phytophthora ramorum]